MNYRKHYNLLIKKALNRTVDKTTYTETHHIIPRSEGGSNDASNLVKLYPREHFIAHWLLYRENPTMSRGFAFNMMSCDRRGVYKPSSRAYAEGVEAAAKAQSSNAKGRKVIRQGSTVKYVWDYEIDSYVELGWIVGRSGAGIGKGRHWYNNGTDEKLVDSPQNNWSKGRLKSSTKNKKAISKDGIVKYVVDTEAWLKQGWKVGNEKYYPGYLHLERNQKNRPANWKKL